MSRKSLQGLENSYLGALQYAAHHKTALTLVQFACCERLDTQELEELREHLEARGIE